jgi:hypothetical protein
LGLTARVTPGLTETLPAKTASRVRSPSFTFIVQVVHPLVWPGVTRAVRVTPPRVTVSPSWIVRSA